MVFEVVIFTTSNVIEVVIQNLAVSEVVDLAVFSLYLLKYGDFEGLEF